MVGSPLVAAANRDNFAALHVDFRLGPTNNIQLRLGLCVGDDSGIVNDALALRLYWVGNNPVSVFIVIRLSGIRFNPEKNLA